MKILLYSRPQMNHSAADLRALFGAFDDEGFDYAVNREFAQAAAAIADIRIPEAKQYCGDGHAAAVGAEMAVSYGGDGTFMDCVKLLGLDGLPILGINSGRLGFLANVPKDNIPEALGRINGGEYRLAHRILLGVGADFALPAGSGYVFNEFSVQRAGTGMISVEVFVDGEMVGNYWGDGVMISTPAGSTAYSLSVGGPVVAPGCGCLVISPIAPHNLTMRPVVVPDTSEVVFRVSAREKVALAAMDGMSCEAPAGSSFRVAKAEKSVRLVELEGISFYDTLRNKMMWGFDRRDGDPQ